MLYKKCNRKDRSQLSLPKKFYRKKVLYKKYKNQKFGKKKDFAEFFFQNEKKSGELGEGLSFSKKINPVVPETLRMK